jgi:hypothetical protein
LYVLIVGHRYGFRPVADNPGGLSMTHLEYRRAGECGLPRVALVRTGIPDVRLSDIEDPEKLALVLAFREQVAREVRPAEFGDLKGLIQGLSTGVQAALDDLSRRSSAPAGARRALRVAPRPVFLDGREELLEEVDALLGSGSATGPRVVVLSGLGGVGKTSLAVEYAHRRLAEFGVVWQVAAEDSALAGGPGSSAGPA